MSGERSQSWKTRRLGNMWKWRAFRWPERNQTGARLAPIFPSNSAIYPS
jgi:hypothetical protein